MSFYIAFFYKKITPRHDIGVLESFQMTYNNLDPLNFCFHLPNIVHLIS